MNPKLNKKVKKFLDDYLRDDKTNSPEHQHSVMLILKGALTDANFHSEAKQLDKFFPKAKNSELVGTKMEDVIESKGASIAAAAKYDGHDIIDAFAFYLNMSIGGGFGNKLNSLKESIEESLVEEGEKLDEKNVPTNPSKWSYYKAQAKKKFDVYPSAYANGWAAKQYKKAGGTWKTKSESVTEELRPDEVEFIANKLGNSMPNHTNYDFDKGPDAKQVLTALKKYHKDFFRHSTNKQKQEIVKLVQKITTESVNESKEEVTPQQLSKIQSDIRKINSKIKVYISKHPITKGELSIELGAGHNDDSEIQKIYKVLKKHTGDWRTGTMFNESVNEAAKKIIIKKSELGKYDGTGDMLNRAWQEFVLRYAKQNNIKFKNLSDAEYIVKKTFKIPSPDNRYNEDSARYLMNNGILVLKESVSESASRTAMEIGGLTGVNKDAIQKFVDDNKLDIEKLYQFVKKGKLADRMKLVSAIAGKPNNPVQKKMVKQFGESVNESVEGMSKQQLDRVARGMFGKSYSRLTMDQTAKLKFYLNQSKKESVIKEAAKLKLGKDSVSFKVMGDKGGLTILPATGNDLDKVQDAIAADIDVKEELRRSLEKQLKIPVETERGYEGGGFRFIIDFYSLAKQVK